MIAIIAAAVIADDAACTSDEFPHLFAVDNIILCYFSPIALYFHVMACSTTNFLLSSQQLGFNQYEQGIHIALENLIYYIYNLLTIKSANSWHQSPLTC